MRMRELDECFQAGDKPMTVAEALAAFSSRLACLAEIEKVPVREALGRILAGDLSADRNIPPHDNSAVDGYAVFFDDLNSDSDTSLPVTGRIAAGHPLDRDAVRGDALQIFTGAPVPEGPDTIFMVEDCREDGDHIILPKGIKKGANLRKAGEDVSVGDKVLSAGIRLRPQDVGMAASLGFAEVEVFKRLKVAVFSTGDEVRDASDDLPAGAIYDTNRYSIMSMLEQLGCAVSDIGIFSDDLAEITDGLAAASRDHDLLVTSGGVSMGEEDHVKTAVEELGALHMWKLAIKPGRPIALGHMDDGDRQVPFIGLPGNPVAVMVTFMCIARPLILQMSGASRLDPVRFKVAAGFDFDKKPGRREWLRALLVGQGNDMVVQKYPADGSGILSSMVESDGLIELPEELETVTEGQLVDFLPFNEVLG